MNCAHPSFNSQAKVLSMSNNFVYPKPRNWEDFEDIVVDLYRRLHHQHNYQRYGRSGQKQFGVGIS